jgi:hypothetical protein
MAITLQALARLAFSVSMTLTLAFPFAAAADEGGRRLFNFDELQNQYLAKQEGYRKAGQPPWPQLKGGGGVDIGGGTLVIDGAEETFLDLYNFPPTTLNFQPGLKVSFTALDRRCGVRSHALRELPHYGYVLDVLQPILDRSMGSEDALETAISSTRFTFVDSELAQAALDPKVYVRERGREIQLKPLATYVKGVGVVASLPELSRMRLQGQLAMFVHELLRQVSIGLDLSLSDKELQEITSLAIQKKLVTLDTSLRSGFEKSRLPSDLDSGFFTPYSIRADLNFVCAWMENRGHDKGPACSELERAEAKDVYRLLPSLKQEVLKSLISEKDTNSSAATNDETQDKAWTNLLLNARSFRSSTMRVYRNGGATLFPSRLRRNQEREADYLEACSDLMKLLAKLEILKP